MRLLNGDRPDIVGTGLAAHPVRHRHTLPGEINQYLLGSFVSVGVPQTIWKLCISGRRENLPVGKVGAAVGVLR